MDPPALGCVAVSAADIAVPVAVSAVPDMFVVQEQPSPDFECELCHPKLYLKRSEAAFFALECENAYVSHYKFINGSYVRIESTVTGALRDACVRAQRKGPEFISKWFK